MIYIETGSVKPYDNLAFEEYFLKSKELNDDIIMLWQNEPTIVVGRFQNTLEEINRSYTDEHHIHVVRRISGGGSVYHDLGNLCFTFLLRGVSMGTIDAGRFARPVVKALAELGIQAEVSGRNDLTIDGKKFSGNAMALHKDRLLYHGTLLYDSDLDVLSQALNVRPDKIESKGIKSVKSRVTNIKPYTRVDMDILQFKQILKGLLFEGTPSLAYQPTSEDLAEIQKLVESKYLSWDWNFGTNPHTNVQFSRRYPGGKLESFIELEKGIIKTIQFRGDFLGVWDSDAVEQRLANVRYVVEEVSNALVDVDISKHFGSITKEEVVSCIMGV